MTRIKQSVNTKNNRDVNKTHNLIVPRRASRPEFPGFSHGVASGQIYDLLKRPVVEYGCRKVLASDLRQKCGCLEIKFTYSYNASTGV